MSITGSLVVGYENNNEINVTKKSTINRSLLNITTTSSSSMIKPCPSLNSSISNSIITTASSNASVTHHHQHQHHNQNQNQQNNNQQINNHQQKKGNRKQINSLQQQHHHNQQSMHQQIKHHGDDQNQNHLHLNSLWSIWYGILMTLFQGYLAIHGAYRFLGCSLIQWKIEPIVELNIQIIVCGIAFVLLPLFFASAVFKVGNLANDGIKLASTANSRCSVSPHDGLEEEAKGGTLRALWTHGGPTAAFIHIIIAICLLIPRLLLEARIIENGLLPRENIWRTELDFLSTNRDRLVVLSFMTSPYQNISMNDTNNFLFDEDNNITYINNIDYSSSNRKRIQHEYKLTYPKIPLYYDKSDLIEKFRPDDEMLESHESLESNVTSHRVVQTTATPALLTSSSSSLSSSLSSSSSSSSAQMRATATITSDVGINRKITENRNENDSTIILNTTNDILKTIPTTTTTTRSTTTTTRVVKSIRPEMNRKNGGRPSKKHSHKNGGRVNNNSEERKHFREYSKEELENLEIKSDKAIDFSSEFEISAAYENIPHLKTKNHHHHMSVTGTSKPAISTISTAYSTNNNRKTTTKSTNLKDSDIHIVKPEKLPVIIPATPVSTNSKIIEIKTKKKVKRMTNSELSVEIEPEPLIGAIPSNISDTPPPLMKLDGFSGILQNFFGVEKEMDVVSFSHPPSMEFLNLVLALIVWSVRYPAVFWSTTKPFATVFSIQMVANMFDIILSYTGMSTLYKLQIVGQILPIQSPTLLLNAIVTLSLFLLSTILVIASSLILYLYGHGRLAARIRDRCMVTVKNSETWIYFAHCASLCFVLALAVVKAPLMHDLSATFRGSLDGAVLMSALASVIHLFLWIVLWLGLTAKRRWTFKLPPIEQYRIISGATQPLLISTRNHNGGSGHTSDLKGIASTTSSIDGAEDTIYWPKLTPSSPKLKVTFNEVTSTSEDVLLIGGEHDGKRNTIRGATLCISSVTGETDDGDYATLRNGTGGGANSINHQNGSNTINGGNSILHLTEYDELPPPPTQLLPPSMMLNAGGDIAIDDNTSEEGKLLACVRDDSVTYASTRDLEPPHPPPPPPSLSSNHISLNLHSPIATQSSQANINMQMESPEHLVSPLAPVTVTVHMNEAHIASSSTPRCLRRADSGVPNEALTPRSDTTSTTESTISPPERAPSETSSGVHSGEEREEVVIRPRPVCKPPPKPPQPAIQEEPFGRSTNMKMSSFNNDGKSSATLPLTRCVPEPRIDYSHCSTMPLPLGCHQQQQQYKPQIYTPPASKQQIMHSTLPNGVRYSNPHFLRRIPHVTKAESPYGHLGLGAGHHTFSKLLQDPLHSLAATTIPEDRDSANYSMTSEHDHREHVVYANAQQIN